MLLFWFSVLQALTVRFGSFLAEEKVRNALENWRYLGATVEHVAWMIIKTVHERKAKAL